MKKYLIYIVPVIISLVYLIIEGFDQLINYINIFFIIGAIYFFIGCLIIVSNQGGFSVFGYVSHYISRGPKKKEYKNYGEYLSKKELSRSKSKKRYLQFILFGLAFVAVSFILTFFLK